MTARVFVDANVFIYARDRGEPAKQARAGHWLRQLWQTGLGRTSTQVLSEVYVTLTRKLSARVPEDAAWDLISSLFAWHPQSIDEPVLRRAREIEQRYRLSWWDSTVVAAAQLQECPVLLTEDLQDGMTLGDVTVRNPFRHEVAEPAAEYVAVPKPLSRHRPRGRPRRLAGTAG